jgi:dynamin 1-like protein
MSYFFGQSGPPAGPHASNSPVGTSSSGHTFAEVGGNAVHNMHGLRTSLDGNNPAYDMKSLEKHIEAVNNSPLVLYPHR